MKITLQPQRQRTTAFSLLEVMIAIMVFFMAIFAILELTSRNLKMARSLQQTLIDPGAVAAMISLTNTLEEVTESGDLGPEHPEVQYTWTATEAGTNGLFKVNIVVSQPVNGRMLETPLEIFLFRPQGAPQAGATTGTRQGANTSLGNTQRPRGQ
jgi:hypothetical protein